MNAEPSKLHRRVVDAAEAALETLGSVGFLELLQSMLLLPTRDFDNWRHGRMEELESSIQGGPEKLRKILSIFEAWAVEKKLTTVTKTYARAGRGGAEPLHVTRDGDPETEALFRRHHARGDLPAKESKRLQEKLNKAPDLVVFETVAPSTICSGCKSELVKGNLLFVEKGQPLCLACADMDHLVFLPSGDAAMSRRARKHSSLSAVVVRFSRARKRYERRGILVTESAIAQAEEECQADAPERAEQRARSAERRRAEDAEFVQEFAAAILRQYPGCPREESVEIAAHAALRGSGRVGRSAAAQSFEDDAITLAVRAHVRHVHTNYDELLMRGTDRSDARALVREKMDRMLAKWSAVEAAG